MSSPIPFLSNPGHCPTCDQASQFVANDAWLRDSYRCSNCGSIPRERALTAVIESYFPDWRDQVIHESSPSRRGASKRLAEQSPQYITSQFFLDQALGSFKDGVRCENLESLTFANESIGLHVTQDVLEHVFDPAKVFSEIARTLKPGGAHVFTVPMVNKHRPSRLRACISETGKISYLLPPAYHGNPISSEGSLVTMDWGFDICQHIFEACGLFTQIIYIDDVGRGIRAEYIEVLITFKPGKTSNLT